MPRTFSLLAAAAITLAAGAASAEERISFADLDLSRPAHAAIFDARIDRAADALCRDARRRPGRLRRGAPEPHRGLTRKGPVDRSTGPRFLP